MFKNYQWQPWESECPYCGAGAEVFTTTGRPNRAYDGDRVRCKECQCPGTVVIVDEENWRGNYVDWHDEPGCECDWCKSHSE